jgi:hypothetical protein
VLAHALRDFGAIAITIAIGFVIALPLSPGIGMK